MFSPQIAIPGALIAAWIFYLAGRGRWHEITSLSKFWNAPVLNVRLAITLVIIGVITILLVSHHRRR